VSHCGSLCAAELIKKVTKNTSWSTQICTWFRVKQLTLSRRGSFIMMTPATSISETWNPSTRPPTANYFATQSDNSKFE
jgi:hypothetical protein